MIDGHVTKMWDKIFAFDGHPVTYVRGDHTKDVSAVVESIAEDADAAYASVKFEREVCVFSIRVSELQFWVPSAGDKIIYNGATFCLMTSDSLRWYKWADTTRKVYSVYAYLEAST